jgi:hypothetical protein
MIQKQFDQLMDPQLSYLSLGITADGVPVTSISVPWASTTNAYNMKIPNVYIAREDLENQKIMDRIRELSPIGVYTFVPLENYGFLEDFHDLQVVFIREGKALDNIEFLKNCPNRLQLLVEDATIPTLEPLFPKDQKRILPLCLYFIDCNIGNIEILKQDDIYLSELHVLQNNGTNEKDRWKHLRCGKFTYREYDREAYLRRQQEKHQKS